MNTRVNEVLKIVFKLPHLLSSFGLFKWIFGNSIHTKKISNTIERIYYIIKGRFFEWHRLPIVVVSNDQIHFKRCYWYEHRKVPLLYFSTSSLVLLYSWYFQINRVLSVHRIERSMKFRWIFLFSQFQCDAHHWMYWITRAHNIDA